MNDAPLAQPPFLDKERSKWTTEWATFFFNLGRTVRKNEMQNLPIYANNAAAIAAGLKVGTIYRTSTGIIMVVY